jgi:hypothetical protein
MGMTQNQVQTLLGLPTYKSKAANGGGSEVWGYQEWWTGDAVVYFDTNCVVTWVDVEL